MKKRDVLGSRGMLSTNFPTPEVTVGGGSVWYLPIKEDDLFSKKDFLFSCGNEGFGDEWFVEQILSFGVYFGPV